MEYCPSEFLRLLEGATDLADRYFPCPKTQTCRHPKKIFSECHSKTPTPRSSCSCRCTRDSTLIVPALIHLTFQNAQPVGHVEHGLNHALSGPHLNRPHILYLGFKRSALLQNCGGPL